MKPQSPLNTVPAEGRELSLKVKDLNAGYHGKPILQDVSLHLNPGEFVGLVGHNGSGKSTLLMGIAGLTWANATSIELWQQEISTTPPYVRARLGLGMLLQRDGLFHNLSVRVNMELARLSEPYPSFFPQDSELTGSFQSIMQRREQRAGSLSGGERRLLSLAMILARRPTIILADEPTLGLSESLEVAVMEFLRRFASPTNQAAMVVSHNLRRVESFCSRSYVIDRGKIVAEWHTGDQKSLADLVRGRC